MGATVISIKDLSKSFGKHEVLRKIDMEVKEKNRLPERYISGEKR